MAKGKKTGGRVAGQGNTLTRSFKELVQATYEKLEKDGNGLAKWAASNQTEFYRIASKLIPTQIHGDLNITTINVKRKSDIENGG